MIIWCVPLEMYFSLINHTFSLVPLNINSGFVSSCDVQQHKTTLVSYVSSQFSQMHDFTWSRIFLFDIDLLVSWQLVQSASGKKKPCNWRGEFMGKNIPRPVLVETLRWICVGLLRNWLNCWIINVMSIMVVLRYKNLLINLL